jgi:ribonuclease E
MANNNKMLIDAMHPEETRVVTVHGSRVEEFDFEAANRRQLRGNIYLAKVTRVEPSLQAAFIEYGGNRHGFLAFSEIHPDYYQIPLADRQALLEDEARAAEEHREREERKPRRRSRGRRDGASPKAARTSETVSGEDIAELNVAPENDPALGASDALLDGGFSGDIQDIAPGSQDIAPGSDASADLPQAALESAETSEARPAETQAVSSELPVSAPSDSDTSVSEGATADAPVTPAAELALEAEPMGESAAAESAADAGIPAESEDATIRTTSPRTTIPTRMRTRTTRRPRARTASASRRSPRSAATRWPRSPTVPAPTAGTTRSRR